MSANLLEMHGQFVPESGVGRPAHVTGSQGVPHAAGILNGSPALPKTPAISVIVPVRNGGADLHSCLTSLRESDFTDYELIVVDDASTDDTAETAAAFGARVVKLLSQGGPAQARNRGAEVARGEYLLFIDADVCVSTETLSQVFLDFSRDPKMDAVFGSYDRRPRARNCLSQYKNLFHHYIHQQGRERATTFWSGCGAIKRSVFLEIGGFKPEYTRPSIEDIELGARLLKAGRNILLDKQMLVTHLKRWTFRGIVQTDVLDRAIPWTELILQQGALPNDLNLRTSQRISAVLAFALFGLYVAGAWFFPWLLLAPILGVLGILALDFWSARTDRGPAFKVVASAALIGTCAALGFYCGARPLLGLPLIAGIILLNYRFYAFLAKERHIPFAILVVPMHVFYYLYSGLAFCLGFCLFLWLVARWRLFPSGKGQHVNGSPSRRQVQSPPARATAWLP
jgi:glycosyltransferase involved in cell wall biosynthesis